jgi:hypothetical protein
MKPIWQKGDSEMTIPAKSVDKAPRLQFAVLSVEKGSQVANLESSFDSEAVAGSYFDRQYSKWGFADINFYLVDWQKQTVIKAHVVWQ